MKLRIRYQAQYQYAEPVSLSPHTLRIFPKCDQSIRILSFEFTPPAQADCQYRRDIFDNSVACLFFPEVTDSVPLSLDILFETPARNPFHFLLESHALEIPFSYEPLERAVLAAYLEPDGETQLPAHLLMSKPQPTLEVLVNLIQWLHQNIAYERREEGDPFAPSTTLEKCAGSCRDFSVLMLEILRQNGLAARLASGYLWEGEVASAEKVAEGALHAWVEAYLPGAGWVGIDPTNGVLCDHHAITAAVGLTHAQIAPVSGFYYGKKIIPTQLQTHLTVEALPE